MSGELQGGICDRAEAVSSHSRGRRARLKRVKGTERALVAKAHGFSWQNPGRERGGLFLLPEVLCGRCKAGGCPFWSPSSVY